MEHLKIEHWEDYDISNDELRNTVERYLKNHTITEFLDIIVLKIAWKERELVNERFNKSGSN